jgi:TPR repeat protein
MGDWSLRQTGQRQDLTQLHTLMRAALLAAATVLLMSYPAAQEQATTAAAAEAAQPDETAAFLLATMYESGRGVPADPVAACVYYSRAMGGRFSGGSASSAAIEKSVRVFRVVRGH